MAATGGASGGSRVKSAPGVYPSSKTSIDAVEEHELGGVIADVAEQLVKTAKKPKVPQTRMVQLVAVHRLNGALLSVADYASFCRLCKRIVSPQLVDVVLEMVESGEALTFFGLRLLCSLANIPEGRRLLLKSGVAEVLFGLFRAGSPEHVGIGSELLVLATASRTDYKSTLFSRGGAAKVLAGLLHTVGEEDGPMSAPDTRMHVLQLVVRAVDDARARPQLLRANLLGALRALDGSSVSTLRERELIRTIRRTLDSWAVLDRKVAAQSAAQP